MLAAVPDHEEGEQQEELNIRTAAEIAQELREALTPEDFERMFNDLDKVEELRVKAANKKNSALQRMVDKGCNKAALLSAWNRRSRPKKQQSDIDATFAIACEMGNIDHGQSELFDDGEE